VRRERATHIKTSFKMITGAKKSRAVAGFFSLLPALFLLLFHPDLLRLRRNNFRTARLELFHAASRIEQFLFTGVERVAVRTHLDANLGLRCAHRQSVAARANDLCVREIFRMCFFPHVKLL